MIKVRVTSSDIRNLDGVSKTTGKEYHLRMQTVHGFFISPEGVVPEYPDKFDVFLEKDQSAYAPGWYTLHPSAVYLNFDGKLSISPRLTPIKPAA